MSPWEWSCNSSIFKVANNNKSIYGISKSEYFLEIKCQPIVCSTWYLISGYHMPLDLVHNLSISIIQFLVNIRKTWINISKDQTPFTTLMTGTLLSWRLNDESKYYFPGNIFFYPLIKWLCSSKMTFPRVKLQML